jgi:ribosomal protein S12 methylthiotransferase accessory factor
MSGLLPGGDSRRRNRDVTVRPDRPGDTPLAGLGRVGSLVDSRFGPVLGVHRQRLGGAEPPWWLCTTRLARFPIGSLYNKDVPTSAGTSLDANEAAARAIGEALERYCGLNTEVAVEKASLRDGVLLGRWPVCAPDEPCLASFRSLPSEIPLTQVWARRLSDGTSVLVPAGFVCLGFHPNPPEPPITLPISTGLAFHPELHQAIWRGLCEVVERDAVMSFWWIHRAVPEIDLSAAPHIVRERLDRLMGRGMTARLYDITTELGIPTVFCVLSAARYPHLAVSAATRASPAVACAKALDEVVSLRVALQARAMEPGAARSGTSDPTEERPVTLVDHARRYASGDRDAAFDFLLGSGQPAIAYPLFAERSIAEPADMDSLTRIAERLEGNDVSVLWVDLTAPEVSEIGAAVRVVIPELVPLSPDDNVRWLGTTRLLRRAGVETAARSAFTSHPHPFA